MGPGAGRGGRAWARATANSRYSVSGFHCAEPSACARVCAVARPSAIQPRNWSALIGPYSRPSAPMILYISRSFPGIRGSEPLFPPVNIHPHELLVGLAQIDNALDQANDVHHAASEAARQEGDEQHDQPRASVTENEFVHTERAEQDAANARRDLKI